VLLPVEARARGFRNALAFRRWCRQRGVQIRVDGRRRWVASADVDAAIGAMPARASETPLDPAVSHAVESLMSAATPRGRRGGGATATVVHRGPRAGGAR
jgi:hypothetical protein